MHAPYDQDLVKKTEQATILLTLPSGSGIRNKAATKDDFPAPVRPATPTFSLAAIEMLMPFKVAGVHFK